MTQSAPKPAVFIDTYGCQMNVLDSELVQGQLTALGYDFVTSAQDAGVVLLNTCSVRELSEQKVWSHLGRLGLRKADQKNLIIGVLGCMAEREGPAILKRMPHVDVVCGPSNLDRLPTLIDNARQNAGGQLSLAGHTSRRSATLEKAQDGVATLDLSRATSPLEQTFQAYVRITRGCNKFCAFCVVPFTRGPEVHRAPGDIIEEIRRLLDKGVREVTLIGQTVNHYEHKADGKTTSFADLLYQVHEQVPDLWRLRFVTSYPRDFGDDALDAMAACPRICRYLHIPAQSGSNTMLRKMNRGYTRELYLDLLARARARMPDISLSGDMIVGYSGETDADHESSISLLQEARYKSAFIFKYSPRSGTVAARRLPDDVPDAVKKARNLELLAVQSEISKRHHEQHIGRTVEVLVEGQNKLKKSPSMEQVGGVRLGWADKVDPDAVRLVGRTGGDEIVAFDGSPAWIGQIVQVRGLCATPLTLMAEAVQPLPAQESAHLPIAAAL